MSDRNMYSVKFKTKIMSENLSANWEEAGKEITWGDGFHNKSPDFISSEIIPSPLVT
jgi:hypothetical protein